MRPTSAPRTRSPVRPQEVLRAPDGCESEEAPAVRRAPRKRFSLIPSAPDSAAGAFLVVSMLWLVVATGIGALGAMLLAMPELLKLAFEYQFPVIGTVQFELSAPPSIRAS